MLSYIINSNAATILVDDRTFTVRKDHINWNDILDALAAKDEQRVLTLVDIPETLKQVTAGRVTVSDEGVFFNGEPLHTGLANRILELIREGYQGLAEPLSKFLDNLMSNPSRRAVQGLYEWLENSNLPITDDGHFIAWKIVGPNFESIYSMNRSDLPQFDNSPGKVVEVERNQVDEDIDRTCSYGLHFCSCNYLPSYGNSVGNRVVMVKVNPRDVVAFPRDYNTAKGRACRYEVVREFTRETAPAVMKASPGVIDPNKKSFTATGLYTDNDGKLVLFNDGNNEFETGLAANGDYTFEDIPEGIRLLPSKRIVKF
jgi:hypothetical protein